MQDTQSTPAKATFGAGCFWGVEDTFRQIPGVLDVIVGYTGGSVPNPTYEVVCNGTTGHAEAVEITYDPEVVTYEALLKVFWENHNPTTRNQQGPDFGSQYRSVIFYHTPEQKVAAEQALLQLEKSGKWKNPVVTDIVPAKEFYKAEDYHQQYLKKNGLSSCHY
ncbi:peptide-methionine (S)-S-oxide reductase MsrA [Candidatus Peribacteria bacterium]|nr:MAG: peptide-methionine (S)-S-oxide reductase MsrA [Candidatus Peribacteria bacterium]